MSAAARASCWACDDRQEVNGFGCPVCGPLAQQGRTLLGYRVWIGPDGGCVVAGRRVNTTHGVTSLTCKPLGDGWYRCGKQRFRTLAEALRDAETGLQFAGASAWKDLS